jgi:hypothetical protein
MLGQRRPFCLLARDVAQRRDPILRESSAWHQVSALAHQRGRSLDRLQLRRAFPSHSHDTSVANSAIRLDGREGKALPRRTVCTVSRQTWRCAASRRKDDLAPRGTPRGVQAIYPHRSTQIPPRIPPNTSDDNGASETASDDKPAIYRDYSRALDFNGWGWTAIWRREWDSNPRYGFPYTRFPSERLQPLGHPSGNGAAPAI